MKPFDALRRCDWPTLLLSFCLALGMWYGIAVRDRLEAQLEVRLDYKGIPEHLVVTDGLINKMVVRLRGPEALLRAINPQTLIQVVNLSKLKKGTNIIPLNLVEGSPTLRAFELVEIIPPRLTLQADNLAERGLAVIPDLKSSLGKAVKVSNLRIIPPSITARGPESVVNAMKSVPLTIPLDLTLPPGPHTQTLALALPPQVTASPSSVRATYAIVSERVEILLERAINVDVQDKHGYAVTPGNIAIRVEAPEALAKNAHYLEKAAVNVTPPLLAPGEQAGVTPRADLPEGMTLLDPLPAEVTVTKTKK